MELLYIWLGKSKSPDFVFENQGFKFSGEYEIIYDNNNSELVISYNDDYDNEFYRVYDKSEDKIKASVRLSCIVGKNGAGKSCLLEMLQSICNENIFLPSFNLDNYENYLILWKDNNNNTDYNEYYNGNLKVEISNYENVKNEKFHILLKNDYNKYQLLCGFSNNTIIKERIVKCPKDFYDNKEIVIPNTKEKIILNFSDNYTNWAKTRENINIIYYSNDVFENTKKDYSDLIRLFDISSSYYLHYDNAREREMYQSNCNDLILSYRLKELQRKVYFYFNKANQDFLKNHFKNHNLIRSHFIISSCNCNEKLLDDLYKNYPEIIDFRRTIHSLVFNKITKYKKGDKKSNYYCINNLKWFLARETIYQFLRSYISYFNNRFLSSKSISLNSAISSPKDFVEQVLGYFSNRCFPVNLKQDIDDLIKLSMNFFDFIDELGEYQDNKYEYEFYIKCEKEVTLNCIFKLIDIYKKMRVILFTGDFASYTLFPRFSSGENGLITLLSRFYYLVNYDRRFLDKCNSISNVLILIDEGEVGFHPEWSKEYLYAVLSYVQILFKPFKKIKNIHFIITTNDPIILSDVLPKDIIYLENRKVIDKSISAFGSNILDLYSDNFFISDGLIGQYAKDKISYVLKCIEKNEFDDESNFIIENIGDENIKNYLFSLFNNKISKV